MSAPQGADLPSTGLPFTLSGPRLTPRLRLRYLEETDGDDLFAYHSQPEVCRHLPYTPRSREQIAEKLARALSARTLAGAGDFWQLGIERRDDPGRVIGDVFFSVTDDEGPTGEIGWVLHPDSGGAGYMSEAAAAMLEMAFAEMGMHRVIAQLDPGNHASAALCERLGMRREATFIENGWLKGEWADTAIYAILAREWATPWTPEP